jgi:uncharacterized protein
MPPARRLLRATLPLLVAVAVPARAQDAPAALWTREVIRSSRLAEERTILIATPENYATSKDRYPVLVLLDANDRAQFTLAVANVAFLASRNAIPPLIVVGVTNGRDRTHDMTPAAVGKTATDFGTAGGANAFADFIAGEVLPMVRAKYRTLPATILAGHSFGGLFALHVAATRPGAFAGVIAISPSLWWNDSTLAATYADAVAKSAATTRLFVTSGGLEPEIDRTTQRFVSRLDSVKPATLSSAYRRYPEDTHGLTPAPSLADGLRFVFEPVAMTKLPVARLGPSSDSAAVVAAVLETEQTYARNARSLGLPEKVPEPVFNNLGYGVLQALKKPDLAIWVFQRNVALYPGSANVYDSLGDAYVAKGDTAAAKAQFRRAVAVAMRTHEPVLAESRRKLESLEHAAQAGKVK